MPARWSEPEARRHAGQGTESFFRHAGNTATWRQFISASAGVPAMGIGSAVYYRESMITAIFGRGLPGRYPEMQMPGGMMAEGEVTVTTRERLGRQDELLWRGTVYRVESDPAPARMDNCWITQMKRGEG